MFGMDSDEGSEIHNMSVCVCVFAATTGDHRQAAGRERAHSGGVER